MGEREMIERRWIGVVPSGLQGPAKVTRLERVAEIWRNQGLFVTEWVPATTIARLSEALAEAEKKGAENWQPIETAPKGRVPFLALNHDREVHVAAYDEHGRLMRRSHSAHRPQSFSIENGRKILLEETEEWRNDWVFWTRLYEFRPTHWRPLPAPPRDLSQGGQHG